VLNIKEHIYQTTHISLEELQQFNETTKLQVGQSLKKQVHLSKLFVSCVADLLTKMLEK